MENRIDLNWLLNPRFLKHTALGTFLVLIVSFIITSPIFLKPMYESETIFYAPVSVFSQQYYEQGIGFGGNEEIDLYIQILLSNRVLDSINSRFEFDEKWNIDIHIAGGLNQLHDRLRKKIDVRKTRYSSISITVRDQDPTISSDMANAMLLFGEDIREDLLSNNRTTAYEFARANYEALLKGIENKSSIEHLASSNPTDQLKPHQYMQQLIEEAETQHLLSIQSQYSTLKKNIQMPLPKAYIVSEAIPTHLPAWPPRILLILASVIAFVIFMIFIEIIKTNDKSNIQQH